MTPQSGQCEAIQTNEPSCNVEHAERPIGTEFIYIDKSWARYIFEVFTDEMNGNLGVMSADEMMAVISLLEGPLNLYQPLRKENYQDELNWTNLANDFPYLAHDIERRLYWLPPKRDTHDGGSPTINKRLVSAEKLKKSRRKYPLGFTEGIPVPNTRRSVKTGEVLTDLAFHLHIQTGYTMNEWFVMLAQFTDSIAGDQPFSDWLEDDEYPVETYFRKFKSGLYGKKNGRRIARRLHHLSPIDSELALHFRSGASCAELLTEYAVGDKMGANFPGVFIPK